MKAFRYRDRTEGSFGRQTAASFAAAWLLLIAASPASATFHLAHIERILTGLDGNTDVQFVQIEMDVSSQQFVDGAKLIAFDAAGEFSHVVLELDKNVAGGAGRSFLMASTAFEETTGLAPDFVFSTAGGNALPAEAGMVCWGKPDDETDPNDPDMVDCISYGNYTGPDNEHTDEPSPVTPFGHGLGRIGDTHSSAADFKCEDPTTPITNAPDKVGIVASTPCPGAVECGNGTVEEPETCDDGDTEFTPGDYCSATCDDFACGVPTNSTDTDPKTSDALFVLRVSVGSLGCHVVVCDVNGNGDISTSDALAILRAAVGQPVIFDCPSIL
jgi:cysteine-rich repeat protein